MPAQSSNQPPEHIETLEDYLRALAESHSTREVAQALSQTAAQALPETSGLLWELAPDRESWRLVCRWRNGHADLVEPSESAEELPEAADGQFRFELTAQGLLLGELRADGQDSLTDREKSLLRTISNAAATTLAVLVLQRRVRQRNVRDPLTGMFNTRYLEDTLEREVHRARRCQSHLTMIRIEPDKISEFILDYGPESADRLLQLMADLLHRSFRGSDVCARITDFGFCILMPDASIESGYKRAEAVREELGEMRVQRRGKAFGPLTVSVGVAEFPEHAQICEDIIQAAESAVNLAQDRGGDTTCIAERIHPEPA
ncbi:GGDEF domain-containing protein [Halorhodospira halochloris]|uniref:GGDEF domain-containing protein n=1 Tax=Halorhodospira halochloris TaxID=1052 RepID=UPI001EE96563|nr:GGDEF domain-containing protein [Halorhodospira halochloris]MCG5548240.1 GGDEF domain-containing protein [Halorhodospira halochloris]